MKFFRRSLIVLSLAVILPTVVFAAVTIYYFLLAERQRVETETLSRSQVVMTLIDARLRGEIAALNVLSSSVYYETQNWPEFYPRLQRVLGANPQWSTLVLYDAQTQTPIFDLRQPLGTHLDTRLDAGVMARLTANAQPSIGGIVTDHTPLVFIYVPVIRDERMRYVLAAGVHPEIFQPILQSQVAADSIAAVVDGDGRFIARNLHYAERVGKPATQFVREAIVASSQGFYRGTTYEGFENYTAYYTSPWSGWSAHTAVASSLIDRPRSWSFVVIGLAALGSALLGTVLVVLVLREMAERRLADDVLRQSQKMEAVGQLTGGIAHDFNNLLTAIIGNLDMIRTKSAGNERLQRLADNGLEAARRGAKLSSQLLAFSRTQRMEIRPVALDQLFSGMSGLLMQSVGPAVKVHVDVAADARVVTSDANQLELALINVAVNARDAMPNGGVLTIAARRASAAATRDLPPRDYVEISVSDTGAGMSDEVRVRAIEPFFTTKPVGQGTGLGLSQVYGVVRESGGALSIVSEPARGTTVRLFVPAASESSLIAESAPTARAVSEAPPGPVRSVLVVDDDTRVRGFMVDCLRDAGYRVTETADGASALEFLADNTVELLVADFAMPGMNGAELARAARKLHPEIAVLIVSGYSDSDAIEAAVGRAHLLRKPFNLDELEAAVAQSFKAA
jgi:signal transduction histidine kinase